MKAAQDRLGERSAAALAVCLSCAALFLLIWLWWDATGGDGPFYWSWRTPVIATALFTALAYLMPEKMVKSLGRLLGTR
ncbi:MAG TPA: hypothetical protein VF651_09095 [Gammaproteobacteria bacterium]